MDAITKDRTLKTADRYAQQGNFKAAHEELLTFKERFPSSALMASVDRMLPEIERRLGTNSK